ncbi:MAG TPA: iron-containing alcohol dehydrogenase [Acidimicrobiia bacterium]|nr:iron-containing alcohol dehydrogenase [Acidimicrobiia bacterium]
MSEFPTVFGRNLVERLPEFVHGPYLVVTMTDLWPTFRDRLSDGAIGVHFVETLELSELEEAEPAVPDGAAIVGLGGGQAVDVAKYLAWKRRRPLFQVPTAMTVNAPFGHRAGLRVDGIVRYLGYAVPEAVYVDYDVIRSAPPALNRSGVGDILCYHTAHRDWEIADAMGRTEPQWPYDPGLVEQARLRLESVLDDLDEIRDVTDRGIRTLMSAHRWGGATFHDSGWNPRHIEGMEHFVFYNLERITGRHFIHGQPVGLGIYLGSLLQDNEPDRLLDALHRVGVDIRPEAMGVTWTDVGEAVTTLPSFVEEAGLWFTAASAGPIPGDLVDRARSGVVEKYGEWS